MPLKEKQSKVLDSLLEIYQFKNQLGDAIEFVGGQKEMMESIVNLGVGGKQFVQIETPTQYGKSSAIAAAVLMRCTKKESWAIVAGTSEKAQIIMDYFIDYALENAIPRKLLSSEVQIDKLKQERSRRRLTFSSGFEIRVFSSDSRNKQATGNAIMGFGAPFVILDEAALVDNVIEAKIFRMIGGFSNTKYLYIKIGNPFNRNHFLDSHNDPDYHLIHIDYHQAIEEGRLNADFIRKAKEKPQFDVLFEVKFPAEDAIDLKGWMPLLTDKDVERAIIKDGKGFGFLKIGVDPAAEGNNFNIVLGRWRNYAKILIKEQIINQFDLTARCIDIKRESPLPIDGFWVDRIGIGEGYYQTMTRDLECVHGVNVGLEPIDKDMFVNLKAEAFWKLREDIKGGKIQLEEHDDWKQLAQIKYRTRLEGKKGKIEIMGKEEMRSNGIDSPDAADALMLTYVSPDPMYTTYTEEPESGEFDKFGLFADV